MARKALQRVSKVDVVVVGAGLSGLAAAWYAARRGMKTVVLGWTRGELPFASGLLDLLGVFPVGRGQTWDDPWAGVAALIEACPEHPYGRLGMQRIKKAWDEFLGALAEAGMEYHGWPDRNAGAPTAAGSIKTTYRVPRTMWPGVEGLGDARPALIVDFNGMKDFSAMQVAAVLGRHWPGLRARRLSFPYPFPGVDRNNLQMAEALDSTEVRAALASLVRPEIEGCDLVGFPAILGMRSPRTVAGELEAMIGKPVFEIPTLPPSVPGHRLMGALDTLLTKAGVDLRLSRRLAGIDTQERRCVGVRIEVERNVETIETRGLILATGRFIGGGLSADMERVHETLLDLPVHQPERREQWHRERFFDLEGHPLSRAGLLTDESFRPLDRSGGCAFENLFAIGSILAHHDWIREKSGSGIALATAYGAVESLASFIS